VFGELFELILVLVGLLYSCDYCTAMFIGQQFLLYSGVYCTAVFIVQRCLLYSSVCITSRYWKCCVKNLDGNDSNFLPTSHGSWTTTMHLLTPQYVREFLATKQTTVLEHPACSLDLGPNDIFLFPKIKEILKGRHFGDIDDISSNTTAALKAILQNQFQNYLEGWTRGWHRCVAFQGEYFEGDHGGIQQ